MHTVRIGLMDDDSGHLKLTREFLGRYEREGKVGLSIGEYQDGLSFVEDYDGTLDVVFLGIKMPHIDGMTAVKKIRERDQTPRIVFVTNTAQSTIHGYKINVINFIVKSVSCHAFADKLKKAIRFSCARTGKELVVQTEESIVKLTSSQFLYIEKDKNYLVYHTLKGEFRARGILVTLEESLKGEGLPECISDCLVNLRHVTKISKDMVWVEQTFPPISRHRSRGFKEGLMRYLGGDY